MRAPILTTFTLSSVTILGIAHITATHLSLYWRYLWYDYFTHMLGGVCLGLIFLLTASYMKRIPIRYFGFTATLSFVLILGLLWEIFEMYAGLWGMESNIVSDTLIDITMDVIGGVIAYGVGSHFRDA